jgi:hypothetical protein
MRHDEFLGLLHYLLVPGQLLTPHWPGVWEMAFWAIVLVLTVVLVHFQPRWMVRAEDTFRRISQHRGACVWAIGGAVLAIRTLLLPLVPVPIPVFHDEFSFLVGADTFAFGRLTNPPHPLWVHFETFHVNMQPTYQSMYPPAQGLVLALGQKLTGEPWIGVLLSVAVMCSVFCWMLQGWMAPQWALLGGLFAVARYGIFSYWINSYFGGAVAAIGGALLLGSLPRLRRRLSLQQGLVFVLGLVILANSRPFEGFLFALPFLFAVVWMVLRSAMPRRRLLGQIVLPCLLLLGLAVAWMLYYNWRGTGNPLQMPYVLNQVTYHISKPFFFQKPYPIPHYRHPEMRAFYMYHEFPDVVAARNSWGMQALMEIKFFCYYSFLVWPLLLLFIPGLILAAADRELRIVFLAIVVLLMGLTMQIWPAHGHYAAPAAGAVILILLTGLRQLRKAAVEDPAALPTRSQRWFPSLHHAWVNWISPNCVWLSRAIVLGVFLWMLVPIADRLWNPYALPDYQISDLTTVPLEIERARIEAQLSRLPGRQLVLVHFHKRDVPSVEWIYNRADIDNSKVVWARDMGPEANQELLRYYANRNVWYVDRTGGSLVIPYAAALSLSDPAGARMLETK